MSAIVPHQSFLYLVVLVIVEAQLNYQFIHLRYSTTSYHIQHPVLKRKYEKTKFLTHTKLKLLLKKLTALSSILNDEKNYSFI